MTYVNQGRQLGMVGVLEPFIFGGSISGYYMCGTNHHDAWCGGCGRHDFYDKQGIMNDSICCKKELLPEHPKKGMLN